MKLKCPECESLKIKDEGDSVMSCNDCDLIFDSGPKWTSYNPDTVVPSIPQEQNINSRTIMKWQKETRTGNLASRSILLASDEIERIAFDLKVDNTIKESALEIFSSSSKAGLVRGRSSEKVAAAAIYTACRMENVPRTLDEVADKTNLNRNELSRLHRLITRKLKLKISITNTSNLLPRFSDKLALNRNIEIYAQDIINTVENSDYRQGISPTALLGASLYLSCKKYKVRRSQLEIAKAVGTSEVTLRNRAKEIIKLI
ncbi:transcription initiation factor IIB family protein [Euryarchaeota archaeon]|jgi:transcription initiation factor TFIIB|nr:transcription initiation factor IIB family protein [Euryarchaeota archaeon]